MIHEWKWPFLYNSVITEYNFPSLLNTEEKYLDFILTFKIFKVRVRLVGLNNLFLDLDETGEQPTSKVDW